MKLSYRADGRLREATLHDVERVEVIDCSKYDKPFISVDMSNVEGMELSGYLTIDTARELRDALVALEL